MPYPDRPYMVSAIATYPGGIERELVEYGDPCTETVRGVVKPEVPCGAKPTYLQGGTPRCALHLSKLCKHGEYSHMACAKYFYPTSIRRLQKPRPQTP